MPNETFGAYILGLPSASIPLVGPESLYVNQGTVSSLVTYGNIVGSMFPVWTAYTPGVSASIGSITTTGTIGGRFFQIGKLIHVEITIPIITNGSGSGAVLATLPVNALRGFAGDAPGIIGRTSTNKSLNVAYATASQIGIYLYDGTYPGASGVTLALNGSYESI